MELGRLWDRIHKEERSHLKVAERKGIWEA